MWEVRQGDCVAEMAKLEPNSVDAVVCDPPYGLEFMGKEWDSFPLRPDRTRFTGDGQPTTANGFAGGVRHFGGGARAQEWHQAWATEALRVLKPGGHLLAFGGTRTYHRLVCAVEDAGFEIRDTIAWMYGSGFPKSLDVSKAIDRQNGRTAQDQHRLAAHIRERRQAKGLTVAEVASWFPQYREITKNWERTDEHGARVPTLADWSVLSERLGLSDDHLPLVERIEAEREKTGERTHVQGGGNALQLREGERREVVVDETLPATPEAQQWDGWGTALKPAHEPVVVARKPLSGTVAANVLEHGVGGLNIDGCRVGLDGAEQHTTPARPGLGKNGIYSASTVEEVPTNEELPRYNLSGRWPANVVLDEEAARLLDEQSGESKSPAAYGADPRQGEKSMFGIGGVNHDREFGDRGGASRFFYTAKASRGERNAGLEGFEGQRVTTGDKWATNDRRSGTARQPSEWKQQPVANHHPTVKPIALMRWLVRLVTPPNGLVLDPFTGSGTTGCAAVLEGFDFLGLEREPEYVEIAKARIAYWADPKAHDLRVLEAERLEARAEAEANGEPVQLDIFDLGDAA